MRRLVRQGQYILTVHGQEALEDDDLTIFDVEQCFLTGRIVERQQDRKRGEWKYLIRGKAVDRSGLVAVAKIGPTRKLVIVTVYIVDGEAR